jgi:hypothetical protein
MKRILSLDGGGIRGIFTLQILARIEALLRDAAGRPGLVLADAFDLIAGTSTGAIIAAFLSWGKTVAEIEKLYMDFGPLMFKHEKWYRRWLCKYRADLIADFFKGHFSEDASGRAPATMGTKRLRTRLLIMMRNASTGSPWPVTNNPEAHYNDPAREDCNLNVPLWQLLRASTAAPTFFPPEQIDYGSRRFLFVDGGVTPFNNPSLIAFLTATLPQYGLRWPMGRDALHLISVGTGEEHAHLPPKQAAKINLLDQGRFLPAAFMGAVAAQQDLMCRILGDCLFGKTIDRELADLHSPSLLPAGEQKFSYVRYNQVLDTGAAMGVGASEPLDMHLDRVENLPRFRDLGLKYAKDAVRAEHLFPRSATMNESSF